MEKRPKDVSRATLSMVVAPTMPFYVNIRRKDDYQFRDITYTRRVTDLKIV